MSTAEQVYAMLQAMPGTDVQVVIDVTKALYEKQKTLGSHDAGRTAP